MTPAVQPPSTPAKHPARSPVPPPGFAPASPFPIARWADPSLYRFSVAQYQKMIEAGILTDEDRVELLEGYVVYKMPRNTPHDGTLLRITKRLGRLLPPGWDVRVQSTVELQASRPEPDLAVVREDPADYTTRHPTAADVGLLIEVADSSLLRDQREKNWIYAAGSIPVYWIVNLVDRVVEVYTRPSGPAPVPSYRALQSFQPGDPVPLVLDGNTVATVPAADLLP